MFRWTQHELGNDQAQDANGAIISEYLLTRLGKKPAIHETLGTLAGHTAWRHYVERLETIGATPTEQAVNDAGRWRELREESAEQRAGAA